MLTRDEIHELFDPEIQCHHCKKLIDECRCEVCEASPKNYSFFTTKGKNLEIPILLYRKDGDAFSSIEQKYIYHSPDGFEWGYPGSGPSDLALNILALFLPTQEAWRLHNKYMHDVISKLEQEQDHVLYAEDIRNWVVNAWSKEILEVNSTSNHYGVW